jgi:hypothetical protein
VEQKLLAEVCKFYLESRYMQTYQHIRMCLRRYFVGSLVGKFLICVVFGLLPLVATFIVTVPDASAHTGITCSEGERAYIVVGGDTLSRIGDRYGTSWSALASDNDIANPNLIYASQTLCIPVHGAARSVPKQVQNSSARTYSTPTRPKNVTTYVTPQPTPASSGSIEAMINQAFGSYGPGAINVARCESGLNPDAYNASGAAGLFQIMPSTWARTSEAGQSPFNAAANIAAAHEIFVRDGYSWREWTCQP